MAKRFFDFLISFITFISLFWLLIVFWVAASIDTKSNGLFMQVRIGQYGKAFTIFKLRTINPLNNNISLIGKFFRKLKIDELPQLVNVILGQMSLVGPRPDIPGYYDELKGEDRKVLDLKPGITSEATLKYANEEELLKRQLNPLKYNDEIIFPDKVKMNLGYYYSRSFWGDIKIIWKTIFRN